MHTFIVICPWTKLRFRTNSIMFITKPTFYQINSHFWIKIIVVTFVYLIKVFTFECLSYSYTNEKEYSSLHTAWACFSVQYLVIVTLASGPLSFCYFWNQSLGRRSEARIWKKFLKISESFNVDDVTLTSYIMMSFRKINIKSQEIENYRVTSPSNHWQL